MKELVIDNLEIANDWTELETLLKSKIEDFSFDINYCYFIKCFGMNECYLAQRLDTEKPEGQCIIGDYIPNDNITEYKLTLQLNEEGKRIDNMFVYIRALGNSLISISKEQLVKEDKE